MNPYLIEYSTEESVKKYVKKTAGAGIDYLLEHVYGPIYLENIQNLLKAGVVTNGLRLLEFGCGGGMNLIYLVKWLANHNIPVDAAYGNDFSEKMINAATIEAESQLDQRLLEKVSFFKASNENLLDDLSEAIGTQKANIVNSFHFILGVNTFRYCHRSNKEEKCAKDIFNLLVKGGCCVMIDMNNKFPFFRSNIRDRLTKPKEEYALPTITEYAQPFENSGFEILSKKNFCWIPHSAKGLRLQVTKLLSPMLNTLMPSYAMRTLVISKKPV